LLTVPKNFAERLSDAGKSKMVIVIAAMRKLLHINLWSPQKSNFF